MLVGKWPLKPYEERLSQYLFSHRFTLFFSQLQVNVARAIDILSDGLRFQKENYIIQISYLTLRPKNLQFEPSRDPLPSLLVVSFLLWWKWIYVSMWATTHPPVPSPNMNPNISVDCCQVGGGRVGLPLFRYWHWSMKTLQCLKPSFLRFNTRLQVFSRCQKSQIWFVPILAVITWCRYTSVPSLNLPLHTKCLPLFDLRVRRSSRKRRGPPDALNSLLNASCTQAVLLKSRSSLKKKKKELKEKFWSFTPRKEDKECEWGWRGGGREKERERERGAWGK